MACNVTVVEIGQEYLDWATKLRKIVAQKPPVMREEVGQHAAQCPDGKISADGFFDRNAAEEYVKNLTIIQL